MRLLLAVEALQQLARLRDGRVLALGVRLDLLVARFQLRLALLGAHLLFVERVALHLDAMQHCGARRLLVAQGLQHLGSLGLDAQRRQFGLRELPDRAQRFEKLRLLGLHACVGGGPMLVLLDGFELAQLGGHLSIFLRLLRLPPQIGELRADLPDHILEAFEIGFRRLQAQLRLMTAAVKPGDARRVFENAAALLRLGGDELADLALLHQRLATRAGGCVGEQDLHVLRAHFLAVHLVDGARLALDAARNFENIRVVEGGRRGALRIVDGDHHLGHVPRGPLVGARENHVVHRRSAHGLVGGFAHHPAQRFEQIGFAAAVRTDDAREPGTDQKLGRLHEGFEAQKP